MSDQEDLIAQLAPEQVVALTLWGEARGQSTELRRAIASVIVNRAAARDLTPREVCLQNRQFSSWNPDGSFNHLTLIAEAEKLVAGNPVGPIMQECLALGQSIADCTLVDTVGGAQWYYSPAAMIPSGRVPKWARGLTPTADIDGTLFFDKVA